MLRYDALIESLYESVSLTETVQAFHDMLFSVLLDLNDDDETIAVALMCVRLLMHERREVSLERVAAFVRRLCEAALRMRPHQVGTHRDRPPPIISRLSHRLLRLFSMSEHSCTSIPNSSPFWTETP